MDEYEPNDTGDGSMPLRLHGVSGPMEDSATVGMDDGNIPRHHHSTTEPGDDAVQGSTQESFRLRRRDAQT